MKRYLLAAVTALVALLGAQPAGAVGARHQAPAASVFVESDRPIHGIAADGEVVFVTQPAIEPGAASRVVVLDRRTGAEIGELPSPPGGFRFPFALRVSEKGRVAVLDNAGFPPQGAPKIYEYRYTARKGLLRTARERTIDFTGLPLLFAEDLEVLPEGGYVVSESVIGGLWLVSASGHIRPGLFPEGPAPLPQLAGCAHPPESLMVGDLPFTPIGGFAPGVGSLAIGGDDLFFGSSCLGGLHRISLDALTETDRPAAKRAQMVETVSPRPAGTVFESLKGLTVEKWRRGENWIYAGDPFQLQLIRINSRTGERQVLSDDERLFNFPVAATFTRHSNAQGRSELLVASDQEYRWTGLNSALDRDAFERPFLITEFRPGQDLPLHARDGSKAAKR